MIPWSNISEAPAAPVEKAQPAVPVRKSVFPDYIICLEDGKRLKMLKRHLSTSFNLTPDQYREKWGLEASYPMVAPNYAERRSDPRQGDRTGHASHVGPLSIPRRSTGAVPPASKVQHRRALAGIGFPEPIPALYAVAGRPSSGDVADGKTARNRMESRIERLCIERGLKMTGQRRVIARVLSDAGDHPDVEELYRRAAALDQHISIATVYRTVRLLEEQGILERRDFGGGRARYEPTEDGPHYHLIDVETGKVIEFQDPEHERLMQAIAARLGFDVVSLRLELFGRRRDSARPVRPEPDGLDRPNRCTPNRHTITTPIGMHSGTPRMSAAIRGSATRTEEPADEPGAAK